MRLSLRTRLIGTGIGLVAAALAMGGVTFYSVAERVIRAAIEDHVGARANEMLEATRRYQAERLTALRTWAEADAMQTALESADPKFAEDYLQRSIQDQDGAFASVALLDYELKVVGAVRAVTDGDRGEILNDARGKSLPTEGLAKAAHSGKVTVVGLANLGLDGKDPGKRPLRVVIALPITDFAGDLVGILIGELSPRGWDRVLTQVAGGSASPYLPVLTNSEGTIVHTLSGRQVDDALPLLPKSLGSSVVVLPAAAGGRHLAHRVELPTRATPQWSLTMLVPETYALGALTALQRLLAGAFALVLLAMAVASVFAVRQAVRPLTDVAESMTRVAKGDLNIRLPDLPGEDLGKLVRSFNTMVVEVARAREEIKGQNVELKKQHQALAELAARVAHNLRNPLGAIRGAVQFVRKRLTNDAVPKGDARAIQLLTVADREVATSARIIDDLQSYARPQPPKPTLSPLRPLVDRVLDNMAIAPAVQVENLVSSELPILFVDTEQIQRALTGILTNAVEALGATATGKIAIRATATNGHLALVIEDNGEGIAKENFGKVFDPLFTTRLNGTGLGLKIARLITQQHGGSVEVTSTAGVGTSVTLKLPVEVRPAA